VDATKEILVLAPDARVIFSSADIHARKASVEAGAVAFVQKPFTLEELLRVVESVVKQPPASTGKKG
jgi:FixJ family two-component response regulator